MLDDFEDANRLDLGRTPGMARTSDAVLVPVGISTILPNFDGVRGVT